jgi:hypothetical protein
MYHFFHRSFPKKSAGVQCFLRISTEPENLKIIAEEVLPHIELARRIAARSHPDRNRIMVTIGQGIVR